MNKMRSLADDLRKQITPPDIPLKTEIKKISTKKQHIQAPKIQVAKPLILQEVDAYDNTNHKTMIHVRIDEKTSKLLNHFKLATGVDISKMVAFGVYKLFEDHPELKSTVKQFIQNFKL